MSSPGTLRFGQVAVTPSPPPVGYDLIYVKTDDVLYIQDSFGVEVALGSSTAITSLTGEVTATGPGAAVATVSNAAVIGKVLTGFSPGPNSPVLSTDTILQAFQKLQAQASSTSGSAITALTGDVSATGPGSVTSTVNTVGGSSAANVHTAELAANAATNANTPSTIVKRDASGNFSASTITAALNGNASTATTSVNFSGSLSGDVTGTQTTTAVSSPTVTGKLLTGYVIGSNTPISATDSILQAFEKVQGQISTTSGSAITALTGDVSATGPGSVSATIQPNVVDNTKLAQMPTDTLKGNNTGSTSNASDLTVSQVTTMVSGTPVTQTPDQANAPGTAGTLSRSDHIHNIPSGVPVQIGTTNIQGSAASFSLSDHVHNHGNQTVGTLHAIATTSVNGFMSSTDKTKLDTISTSPGTNAQILISDGTHLNPETVSGDISINNTGVTTLATVNANVGSFGSSTSIPNFTVNGKGLITAAGSNVVIAPAGTLTGTTLNSTVVNSSLTSVGTITSGTWNGTTIDIAHGGTSQTTAPSARGPSGLNIDQRSTFNNANYTVLNTDRYVAQVGTMSAPRTVFLPAANTLNAGQLLIIADESGTVSTTNTLTITANGTDTIDGAASKTIRSAYGDAFLISNGSNEWFRPVTGIGSGGTGLSTVPTDGQLLIGQSSTSSYVQSTLTAGTGISITNGGGSITVTSNNISSSTTKTANYTILSTDSTIFCDTSGGAFTLTLPSPSGLAGKLYRIIDTTGTFSADNLTLARSSTEKIEGLAASKVLQTNWGWFQVTTNGTDWFVG